MGGSLIQYNNLNQIIEKEIVKAAMASKVELEPIQEEHDAATF